MSNALTQLKAHQFTCTESIEISDYIQSVLASKPPIKGQEDLVRYAAGVPFYIDAICEAATEQGEEDLIQPILEIIKNYFFDTGDLVPDHHGVTGLLDDAYMVYCFIFHLNNHWAEDTASELVDIDLDYLLPLMAENLSADVIQKIEADVQSNIEHLILGNKIKTAGKIIFGGLAIGALIGLITSSAEQSDSDKAFELIKNRIYNG